ncbi:MAG: arylamine N-acetyltransferase [SAR324 cluster bacterium]|nr:arylamine N-acetyltransferase [SAR324 cluster bacterium]
MSLPTHIQGYLRRLEVTETKPSLALVEEIQRKHLAAFSFNSVAVLLKRPISLEIEDIAKKIVTQHLGGYCFEHNKLIYEALKALGFKVRILIARMVNNKDIDTPRTHRITLLDWEGANYMVDVGFGPNCIRKPLKIEVGTESHQDHLTYRIAQNKIQDFQLELKIAAGFFSFFTFNFQVYTEADCLVGNFYSCQHPDAAFVNNLVVARIFTTEILSLRNKFYHRIGVTETQVTEITSHLQLQSILLGDFELKLTEAECELLFVKNCVV